MDHDYTRIFKVSVLQVMSSYWVSSDEKTWCATFVGSQVQSPLEVNILLDFILFFITKQYNNANIANFV